MPHSDDDVRSAAGAPSTGTQLHAVSGSAAVAEGVGLHHARRGDTLEIEIEVDRAAGTDAPADDHLVEATAHGIGEILQLPAAHGANVHLAADHRPDHLSALPEAVADRLGFTARRDLLQLRRPLPVPADHEARSGPSVSTRPIEPGGPDEGAWIRVNNRSFAAHPDQGQESPVTLHARMDEPWFDPSGFLVADDSDRLGELSGFCWTKVHLPADGDPMMGEIYVIGVDPSHRGEGLGPAFVLAGLDHLAGRGIATSVLYVDADNDPAVRLYDRLGFHTHARRRVYTRPRAPRVTSAATP